MVIRFTSTLTADDETRVAPALLQAVAQLLAPFPISYSMRIETTTGEVVEDSRPGTRSDPWLAGPRGGHDVNGRRNLLARGFDPGGSVD